MINRFGTFFFFDVYNAYFTAEPHQSQKHYLGQFENLVFVIMSTRENTRLIARAPFQIIMYFCLHLVVVLIIGNGDCTDCTHL